MTDKEKKELKDGVINIFKRFNILDHTATIGNLRDDILKYINSLQEENASDDLEKEVKDILNRYYYFPEEAIDTPTIIRITAKQFYELGRLNERKENKI